MDIDKSINLLIYSSDLNTKVVRPIFDHLSLICVNIIAGDIQWDKDVRMVVKPSSNGKYTFLHHLMLLFRNR